MSPALLAVAGFDGYLRRFNPAFEVFGYSREELLSRPWIEFAHPNDRERMLQAAASLERGADVVELDNRVICRDGSLRWVEWSTRVVPEEGLFYAAGRDVTEAAAPRRSRPRCGAWRRWSRVRPRPTRCSPPWGGKSARCSGWTPRISVATTRTVRSSASRSGAVTRASLSARASRSTATACPRGCCGPGDRHAWTTTKTPRRHRGHDAAARHPLLDRRPDLHRGAAVGSDDRHLEGAEPVSRRDRVPPPGLYGARRDRDRERR